MDPACWRWKKEKKKGSRLLKPGARGNFSVSPTWSTWPKTGWGARSTSLWVHGNLFWHLSRDGNLHGSGMSHASTASLKPSIWAPWSVGDAVVDSENAKWTTSESGHICPCQNCWQGPPAEKTERGSLLNSVPHVPRRHFSSCSSSFLTTLKLCLINVPRNEAIVLRDYAPAARGTRPSFRELDFCCLGNYSNTETCFKTNFLPMKRVNSITSYCVVLTFESAKIRWLVREILVSEALEIYFSWIIIASIKFMTRTMDECAWFWVNWGGGEWNCVRD